jgi:hypothetical protein
VKGGKALIRMRCAGGASCRGVVKLVVRVKRKRSIKKRNGERHLAKRTRKVVIGRSRFSIPAGKSKTIRVKLTGKGKRLVRRAGKRGLKVQLTGSGVKHGVVTLKTQRHGKRRFG